MIYTLLGGKFYCSKIISGGGGGEPRATSAFYSAKLFTPVFVLVRLAYTADFNFIGNLTCVCFVCHMTCIAWGWSFSKIENEAWSMKLGVITNEKSSTSHELGVSLKHSIDDYL